MKLFVVMAALLPMLCFGGNAVVYETDRCAAFGHPEIRFEVEDSVPQVDAEWMKSGLESMVAEGSRFSPGDTLQMGWMVLRFEQSSDGVLVLHEPDMHGMPIRYVATVTRTLRALRAQKDVADSFGMLEQASFPSILDVIGVPVDLDEIGTVQLHREPPSSPMSGWYLTDLASGFDQQFRPVSLYELALLRPDLVKFFALPVGTDVVLLTDGEVHVFSDGQPLVPREGSFIEALNRAASER